MPQEPTIDEIRAATVRAGLSLTDEQLAKLQKSTARMSAWGEVIRGYIRPETEPATIFNPAFGTQPPPPSAERPS